MYLYFFIDFDGTLIDSRNRIYELFIQLSGINLSFNDYWNFKKNKMSNHDILIALGIDADLNFPNFKHDWFSQIESTSYLDKDVLLPFVKSALINLSQKGKLFLATSRQDIEMVKMQLKKFEIADYFTGVLVTEHKKAKPILVFDWISLSGLKIDKTNGFMIGDTEEDVKVSSDCGLTSVGVLSGFRNREFMEKLNCDFLFDDIYSFSKTII